MKSKLAFIFLLMTMLISACGGSSGELTVRDAWARPAGTGENGAAYFVIENGTGADDALLSVTSEIVATTEIYTSMADGSRVMSIQTQESIPVSSKGKVDFKIQGEVKEQ